MVTELGLPVSESSTWPQNFMPPTDSEHKFHKTGIKNWLSIRFSLGLICWELTPIATVPCSTTNGERLKVLYTHS